MLNLDNKTVLITGGTGSFGKSFTKFLLENFNLKKLIVFSRDELKQFQMQKEMEDERLRFFIGDIRDKERLQRAFSGVDFIVHAAALKQIPILEYNPFEAIKTNVIGSQNVINAAIDQGVEKILLISTDKAAQPVNLYGATKLCAEKLFINGNFYAAGKTRFSCVRYGNVIGSRGSIVETLVKCRDTNMGKVCITDVAMTRFWITLEQSFALVLFALANMEGGEIFIPKVPMMKLVDMFDTIVPDARREVIGIRPGEKLHEVLITKEEAKHTIELDNYYVILPQHEEINVEEQYGKYLDKAKDLSADFIYSSEMHKDCLTKEDLLKIINEIKL